MSFARTTRFVFLLLALGGSVQAQEVQLLPPLENFPAGGAPVETLPLANWYGGWLYDDIWEKSLEIGIDGTKGNSQTLALRAGLGLYRETDRSKLDIDLDYGKASANGTETRNRAMLDVHHDWLFPGSPWTLFGKMGLEYDKFRAFDLRFTASAGLGYRFIDTDITKLTGRFGAGVSREFGGPDDRWVPEAVLGMDYERKISDRQKFKVRVDYFPDWGDFSSYRLVTDAGWELLIDEPRNLSLKVGIIDRYDSTPNGRKPNDLDYALLLLWKS